MRLKRKPKIFTKAIANGYWLQMRLTPWLDIKNGYVWLASLAISKSRRQLNDWSKLRKNKRVRQLNLSMTGREGPRTLAIGLRKVKEWLQEVEINDVICLRCASAKPEKQARMYYNWFSKHEDFVWNYDPKERSFMLMRKL